jgi:hypothetical protein
MKSGKLPRMIDFRTKPRNAPRTGRIESKFGEFAAGDMIQEQRPSDALLVPSSP